MIFCAICRLIKSVIIHLFGTEMQLYLIDMAFTRAFSLIFFVCSVSFDENHAFNVHMTLLKLSSTQLVCHQDRDFWLSSHQMENGLTPIGILYGIIFVFAFGCCSFSCIDVCIGVCLHQQKPIETYQMLIGADIRTG